MKEQSEGRRPYRGRRPSAVRVRFLELIQSGMTTSQAAREAGCNVRTGRDWANGIVKTSRGRYTFDTRSTARWSGRRQAGPSRRVRNNDSRHGFCRSGNGSRSPTWPGSGCRSVRLPGGWAGHPRRSAGSCDATRIRALATTGRGRHSGERQRGGHARSQASSPATPRCARPSPRGLGEDGARSRSADGCAGSFPIGRRCTWCTRRSTRRSTSKAVVSCVVSWPGACGPAGQPASPSVARINADPASRRRC
jgi:hypothetical protein